MSGNAQLVGWRSVSQCHSAGLGTKLPQPVCRGFEGGAAWEQKWKLLEALVADIRVDTSEPYGVRQSDITVNIDSANRSPCLFCCRNPTAAP